jgi:hypothetical protein
MNENFDIASFNSIGNTVNPKWIINGRINNEFSNGDMDYSITNSMDTIEHCPYCTNRLTEKSLAEYNAGNDSIIEDLEEFIESGGYPDRVYCLKVCPNCFYWTFNGYQEPEPGLEYFMMSAISVSQKFTTTLPTGCNIELAQELRRNTNLWHKLNPRRIETFVADIFKANHKQCEVIHVGRPGDLGVDVLFIDDSATKWLIQVKRRERPKKAEGFSTLQSILGTLVLHGEQHGIIVSTADYFSAQIKKQTINAANRGYKIELIDKGILNRMIENMLPENPWINLFSHPDVCDFIGNLKSSFTYFDKNKDQRLKIAAERVRIQDADPNQLKLFNF